MNFNNEDLNLTILMEECAEVIKVCSKIKRFGMSSYHPDKRQNNRQLLEQELGDLMCMVAILVEGDTVTQENLEMATLRKMKKLEKYYD